LELDSFEPTGGKTLYLKDEWKGRNIKGGTIGAFAVAEHPNEWPVYNGGAGIGEGGQKRNLEIGT